MKKLLAILMALAMMLSLAACGDKEDKKDDEKTTVAADAGKDSEENKEADTASDEKAIKAAVEAYYAALVTCDGTKIKATMPVVMDEILEGQFSTDGITPDQAAQIKDLYGFDVYSADAAFSFYAVGSFERFGKVNSITVDNVKFEKFTKEEIKSENDSLAEEGIEGWVILDGAHVDVVITVVPAEGKETVTAQKLSVFKDKDGWTVLPAEEEDGTASDTPVTPDVTPGANTVVPETPTNAGTVVTPPAVTGNEEAEIKAAASAYFNAMASYNGAAVKNSLSAVFAAMLEQEDILAGITAEQLAQKEAEFGVTLTDSYAEYTVFALSIMSDVGDVAAVQIGDITYEKLPASEMADFNAEIATLGATGINITEVVDAEIEIYITFADGSTDTDIQYISFLKENGAWKAFPSK